MAINSNELLGQVLGTCTLQHLLGRGGMGVVYLARQSRPRRTVAVKVLASGMHTDPGARAEFLVRFRREADAIAALDHINIMPIYEYGEQGEMAYLVMPFVTGGTLRTLLEQKGILSLAEALPIIKQAAAALDCAHAQGIVHRDLKPGNILFHADGRALLADFGLAKVVRGNEDSSTSDSLTTLTSVGTIIGTPEYLSPEQSTGQSIGPYTDIYSLGIVLYQMLGGRVPFTGSSPVTIALKHTMEAPPSLLQLNPTLPPAVETVVMKALAKLPEERFKSASEFAHALHAATLHPSPTPQRLQPAIVENIATITIPNKHKTDERAANDITREPTEERPLVSPLEDASDDSSQIPTEESPRVTPSINASTLPAGKPQLAEYQAQEHMHPDTPELHASETVEAPLPTPFEAPTAPVQQVSPVLPPPSVRQASPVLTSPPVVPSRPPQVAPTPLQGPTDRSYPTQRKGCQSVGMMLLGSLLTLVLVVGGFIAYLNLMPKNGSHPTHTTGTPQATAKTTKPQLFTPPAALIPAGSVLYGTPSPGPQCDSQGGQWSKKTGISVICDAKGGWAQLANTGGSVAGIFLTKLSKGQNIPGDFMLQVEVNINSATQGQFGVFFRVQQGSPGAYSFMINPGNTWAGNIYNNQSGTSSSLYSGQLVGKINGTATLDIIVQGDNYTLYINGMKQGDIQSPAYSDGSLGLAVDAGTT
ncbi:MAG: protein kinase, partial [Ktedonobacteraceae bacterium]|nr:protein kinase [Ktedonobacteraceae bacterium]